MREQLYGRGIPVSWEEETGAERGEVKNGEWTYERKVKSESIRGSVVSNS